MSEHPRRMRSQLLIAVAILALLALLVPQGARAASSAVPAAADCVVNPAPR